MGNEMDRIYDFMKRLSDFDGPEEEKVEKKPPFSITKGESVFTPITITINDRATADALWHALNVGEAMSLDTYCEDKGIECPKLFEFWAALNEVHRPL